MNTTSPRWPNQAPDSDIFIQRVVRSTRENAAVSDFDKHFDRTQALWTQLLPLCPRMKCTRLPPELIAVIFALLHHDKRTLAACSLVCKSWLAPAHYLLFANVTLSVKRALDAEFLKSGLAIIPFIRHIHLDYRALGFPGYLGQKVPLLVGLESIKSLTLTFQLWYPLDHEIRSLLLCQFPNVTRLQLDQVNADSFSQMAHFICGFTCLETLIIDRAIWRDQDVPAPTLQISRNLSALALGSCEKDAVLDWLLSFRDTPALRSIYLTTLDGQAIPGLAKLLQAVGPSLEAFGCTADDGARFIDLSSNTRLRSLMLRASLPNGAWVTRMLSQIVSVDMEEILFTVHARSPIGNMQPDVVGWNEVDAILTQPRFPKLRRVETFPILDRFIDVRGWLLARLAQCRARGILSFAKSPPKIHSL